MGKGHAEPRHLPLPLQPSHWATTLHHTEIVVRDESQVLPLGYVLLSRQKTKKQATSAIAAAAPAPPGPTAQVQHQDMWSEQPEPQVSARRAR